MLSYSIGIDLTTSIPPEISIYKPRSCQYFFFFGLRLFLQASRMFSRIESYYASKLLTDKTTKTKVNYHSNRL